MNEIIEEKNDLFIELINKYNIKTGIEVGVREGAFSRNIMERSTIEFYALDITIHPGPQNLQKQYPNYHLIQGRSPDYASNFEDNFFDWVYIDACHNCPSVKDDLEAWYPKLKTGGIMSGDDYMNYNNPSEGLYCIVDMVENFLQELNIKDLYISHLGFVSKEERLKFANEMGQKWPYPGCKVPNWYFIKE